MKAFILNSRNVFYENLPDQATRETARDHYNRVANSTRDEEKLESAIYNYVKELFKDAKIYEEVQYYIDKKVRGLTNSKPPYKNMFYKSLKLVDKVSEGTFLPPNLKAALTKEVKKNIKTAVCYIEEIRKEKEAIKTSELIKDKEVLLALKCALAEAVRKLPVETIQIISLKRCLAVRGQPSEIEQNIKSLTVAIEKFQVIPEQVSTAVSVNENTKISDE